MPQNYIVFVPIPAQDDALMKTAAIVGILAGLVTIAQALEQQPKRRRSYR